MNREESPKAIFGVIPEVRREKLAMLKRVITEGTYKVKGEAIAGTILKERIFELALGSYNHEYRKCSNN